jgi:hypothetical protein
MENVGGDEPFGGDIPGPQMFEATDRIMAFDVTLPLNSTDSFDPSSGVPRSTSRWTKIIRIRCFSTTESMDSGHIEHRRRRSG